MTVTLCALLVVAPVSADIYKSDKIKFYGDFRTRVEADFDSQTIKPSQIPLLRRKIGVIFQDFKLLPDRDVYQNLASYKKLRKQAAELYGQFNFDFFKTQLHDFLNRI